VSTKNISILIIFGRINTMSYFKDIIEKYKIVDDDEKLAIKFLSYWIENRIKIFPNTIHSKFNKEKDPRKSLAFKYCYKLQRETRGLLKEEDYELYVKAQLHMLKYFATKYNNQALVIEPQCLVGEKAWKRWKFYKFKYDSLKNTPIDKPNIANKINLGVLRENLLRTKKFLSSKLELNRNSIKKNLDNIVIWNKLGNVDIYFLLLCNSFDKELVNKKKSSTIIIDDEIKRVYSSIFGNL